MRAHIGGIQFRCSMKEEDIKVIKPVSYSATNSPGVDLSMGGAMGLHLQFRLYLINMLKNIMS